MSRWITIEAAELALKALEEENARLKVEVERLTNNCDYLDQKLDEEIDKSAMLCGQVERLTKAGDALMVIVYEDDGTTQDAYAQCYHLWNAAKDGKDAQ